MAEEEGIKNKKEKDFSEWYNEVVIKGDLFDYGAVQGSMIIKPYAYAMWEKIQEIFNKMIRKTGHMNAYFPLLIPESFLKKEAEHFVGFVPEVFWVTHAGDDKLGERLAIRPTSETIIYNSYAKWIRSWRDLPILLNLWNNVLRAEIKSTKPFIRSSEFLWQEGHTAHATEKEADEEVMQIAFFYKQLMEDYLAVPVLVGKKTEREKFPGALYTVTLEAMMTDGKALQMATSHNLGQNFSKPFGITFLDKNEKQQYVWTTSWGTATRDIGAIIMTHGDDKGLIIPPKIAPYKVIIIPIYYKAEDKKKVLKKVDEIVEKLAEEKITAIADYREAYTPGYKYNEWEMKGVPIRIEIGPKDLKSKQVVLVRRDNLKKTAVKEKVLVKKVEAELEDIQKNLWKKAKRFLDENIREVEDYKEFKKVLEEKGGFIKTGWCGMDHCEEQVKTETSATIRLISEKDKPKGKCIYCGMSAKHVVYFGKSY